jgi:DNA-binding NarL/FixJ family response regulator
LRDCYRSTDDERIGGVVEYGGTPWLWVSLGPDRFHLNADSKREGVESYLRLLDGLQAYDLLETDHFIIKYRDQGGRRATYTHGSTALEVMWTIVPAIILIVAHIDDRGLFAAVEAGITGILRRHDATPQQLADTIRDAHHGNGNIPPDLLGRLLKQVTHLHDNLLSPNGMHLHGLTDREINVLRLVADGHPTAEIARQLAYSERTIKNIIQDITTRLGLRNRSHAVAYALRQGII